VSILGENKMVALARLGDYLAEFPLEFVIAEDDLVTVAAHERRGDADFFTFHTYRIVDGVIVGEWSNGAVDSRATGSGRPQDPHARVAMGDGDPALTKPRVADFYRCVFDAQSADAVKDFVSEDYQQHGSRVPPGRAGLEGLVRALFPDGPLPTPEQASIPPTILMGEGDLVVIAAGLPQRDGRGGTYTRYLYDAFRVTGGLLAEHWSGVDASNPPTM
jgi:predicted SnoaL-like aldol condensation-catalyzing enzyme